MDWISLQELRQLEDISAESKERPVLIYKHSTRCNVSRTAFDRLVRKWNPDATGEARVYFLDLLTHRDISSAIAERFGVEHQSPQVLIISNGRSILDLSHFEIDFDQISEVLKAC
jgi:bacillithiol system protein YtxJ